MNKGFGRQKQAGSSQEKKKEIYGILFLRTTIKYAI